MHWAAHALSNGNASEALLQLRQKLVQRREAYPVWALADVAQVVAPADPLRAARLITEAEGAADAIPADRLTAEFEKAWVLAIGAKAVAATDPARAARLITDAEGIAEVLPAGSLDDKFHRSDVLTTVAKAMAATNASRAELIAQSIISELDKVLVLVAIAEASSA